MFGEGKRKVRGMDEGTIKTQNPKCRLYWCLIEFVDWRHSQSCWYFRLNTDPDPGFDDQELKNIYSCEKIDIFFISKITIPMPLQSTFKPHEKPSAFKRERSSLKTSKFLNFFKFFGVILPSWIRMVLT
jgi:hypothetical protein